MFVTPLPTPTSLRACHNLLQSLEQGWTIIFIQWSDGTIQKGPLAGEPRDQSCVLTQRYLAINYTLTVLFMHTTHSKA